ncbi:MAG: DUF188 domain-containing protein [Synergistaceae bacterium]
MKFIIDADACPKFVLSYVTEFAKKEGLELITVANFNHQINSANHICVGGNSQEADLKVANITRPDDLIITQDWGLAALIVSKGAYAISPTGKVFSLENIDFLLEERELKARFRRSGGRTKGSTKRTAEDDKKFIKNFNNLFTEIQLKDK